MSNSITCRLLLCMLAMGIASYASEVRAQSSDDPTQNRARLKQQQIVELRAKLNQAFAQNRNGATFKSNSLEIIPGPINVLLGRINVNGELETSCVGDMDAAERFLSGETPAVNYQSLKTRE